MRLSFFGHLADASPRMRALSWEAFCKELSQPAKVEDKRRAPCFSPAEYLTGTTRRKDNVIAVHLAVLDIDSITTPNLEALCKKLEPYKHIGYTTVSHPTKQKLNPDSWALRIILPLDKPIPAAQWPDFWQRLNHFCDDHGDTQCKDPSRLYILPCHLPDDPEPLVDIHDAASILTADTLRSLPIAEIQTRDTTSNTPTAGPISELGQRVDLVKIRQRAYNLRRTDDPERQVLADNLLALLRGKPYGESGKRNRTMLALTWELNRLFPAAAPQAIVDLFAPSHQAMLNTDAEAPDADHIVLAAVEGARRKQHEHREELDKQSNAARADRIRAVRDDGAANSYTDAEIAALAEAHNIPTESLKRHWILRHSNQVFFLTTKGYSQGFSSHQIMATAAHYLSPASSINLHEIRGQGASTKTTFRSFEAVLADYGTDIKKVVYDLYADLSYYDYPTGCLHIASAPRQALEPKEHPLIHEWLMHLGGAKADKLLQWVAATPDMTKKLCAIYLNGPQGVGKTVFAHGISKLWQRGTPTPFSTAVSRFNYDLATCPLVLVDEGFPNLPPKQLAIELRTLIGGDEIRIEQKFAGTYPLLGPRRLIMAANNSSLLDFKSELSHHDIEALAVRILQIVPDAKARGIFAKLSPREFRSWQTHKIAEHALWLNKTLTVTQKPGDRFAVQGEVDDSIRQVVVDGYYPSLACQVIVKFITNAKNKNAKKQGLIRFGGGSLLVNQEGLNEAWLELLSKGPQPPVKLGAVLRSLSSQTQSSSIRVDGMVKRFWEMDPAIIALWCDSNGYHSDDIRRLINRDVDVTEDKPSAPTALAAAKVAWA